MGSCPPTRKNTAAVIVTYNPAEGFRERFMTIARQPTSTVIVDNGSVETKRNQITTLSERHPSIHTLFNNRNLGVARALNQGVTWSRKKGYEWCLTFDQDTEARSGMIDEFSSVVDAYEPSPEKIAMIGSNYVDRRSGQPRWDPESFESAYRETDCIITSGCLVSTSVHRQLGGFDNDFFIDRIDHEYCLRAKRNGFKILVTKKPLIDHEVGNPSVHSLFGKRVVTSNYQPKRRYHQAKSLILIVKRYFLRFPFTVGRMAWVEFKKCINILLLEKQKCTKTKCFIRGLLKGMIS